VSLIEHWQLPSDPSDPKLTTDVEIAILETRLVNRGDEADSKCFKAGAEVATGKPY